MPWFIADKEGYVIKVFGDGEKALRKANNARRDDQYVVFRDKPTSRGEKIRMDYR